MTTQRNSSQVVAASHWVDDATSSQLTTLGDTLAMSTTASPAAAGGVVVGLSLPAAIVFAIGLAVWAAHTTANSSDNSPRLAEVRETPALWFLRVWAIPPTSCLTLLVIIVAVLGLAAFGAAAALAGAAASSCDAASANFGVLSAGMPRLLRGADAVLDAVADGFKPMARRDNRRDSLHSRDGSFVEIIHGRECVRLTCLIWQQNVAQLASLIGHTAATEEVPWDAVCSGRDRLYAFRQARSRRLSRRVT